MPRICVCFYGHWHWEYARTVEEFWAILEGVLRRGGEFKVFPEHRHYPLLLACTFE